MYLIYTDGAPNFALDSIYTDGAPDFAMDSPYTVWCP